MIILICVCVLFALAIITEIGGAVSNVKSANRKARYTMIQVKAIRQLRDTIEKALK